VGVYALSVFALFVDFHYAIAWGFRGVFYVFV